MEQGLVLREIKESDVTTKLSLGSEKYTPLKTFLKKSAYDFHFNEIAKTYVLGESSQKEFVIRGYITLMADTITFINNDQKPSETKNAQKYEAFSGVKIARLAIDKSFRGKNYGKTLLDYSITIAKKRIMPHIGCRFIIVNSKEQSVEFYLKAGFKILETKKKLSLPILFLDLFKINNQKVEVDIYDQQKISTQLVTF